MRKLILPEDMRAREARYFAESGVKSIDAMERAAEALADAVRETVPRGERVWFVCGSGGNGGDGIACARILKDEYETRIVIPKALKSADAIENLRRAERAGVPVSEEISEEPALWVDALLGTGLSREPEGVYARWMDRMNESAAPVIAADIPSGLNGATGRAYGHCVRAVRTIAFGFGKPGLFLQDGLDASGSVTVAPIGFPESAFKPEIALMDAGDVARFLPKRPRNIYKNQCGHLLIVAGSFGMAGAAAMCARGAMRTGVGLITIACPESIVPILQTLVPSAMCVPLPEKDGAIAETDALRAAFAGKTAVVVGCGLSTRANPDAVRAVLESGLPAVIDADGLNLIAENGMQRLLNKNHVITPHPGEARRLLRSAMNEYAAVVNAKANECAATCARAAEVNAEANEYAAVNVAVNDRAADECAAACARVAAVNAEANEYAAANVAVNERAACARAAEVNASGGTRTNEYAATNMAAASVAAKDKHVAATLKIATEKGDAAANAMAVNEYAAVNAAVNDRVAVNVAVNDRAAGECAATCARAAAVNAEANEYAATNMAAASVAAKDKRVAATLKIATEKGDAAADEMAVNEYAAVNAAVNDCVAVNVAVNDCVAVNVAVNDCVAVNVAVNERAADECSAVDAKANERGADEHAAAKAATTGEHVGAVMETMDLEALLRDPIAAARALSSFGACALFKGASCAISDGVNTYVSASGCCGMARGGSGDVLSGILGALMAERSERSAALNAALASEIHGLAGECAQRKFGQRGMTAADIPDCIPEVWMENLNV